MSFINRGWLGDIYKDNTIKIVLKKPSQKGLSEWAICGLMADAMTGRQVMYVLPTDSIVFDFTPRRIDRCIARVPFYKANCASGWKETSTKKQKTLFGVDCSFVGSNVDTNFYEKPIDTIYFDELDKCNADNLIYAYDRIQAASDPTIRMLGNPTFSNTGIDAEVKTTDDKDWFIQCDHCNEWQILDWFKHAVVQEDEYKFNLLDREADGNKDARLYCCRCNKAIDRLADGEWIAKNPTITDASGYNISTLFADPNPNKFVVKQMFADWLAAQGNYSKLQRFYNNVLGITFSATGMRLDESVLQSCADVDYIMPDSQSIILKTTEECVAGVDVGKVLHVHISRIENGKRRKVFIGTCPLDLDLLQALCNKFNVGIGIIDALPDLHFVKQWQAKNPRWFRCYYKQNPLKTQNPLQIDRKEKVVQIGRTESLDMSLAAHLAQRVIIPKNYKYLDNGDYMKQMAAPVRVEQVSKGQAEKVYVWDEQNKDDHHRHADNYECLSQSIYGGSGSALTVI